MRRQFAQQINPVAQSIASHLKFIDESGVHLGFKRFYGRAAPGKRMVEAPWLFQGAMNANTFEIYVEEVLASTLRPGDRVIRDNLPAHKGSTTRSLIEVHGARRIFLPPYTPNWNPIELCWSKVKTAFRAAKARTLGALMRWRMPCVPSRRQTFKHGSHIAAVLYRK